jgi:hypothetical protein
VDAQAAGVIKMEGLDIIGGLNIIGGINCVWRLIVQTVLRVCYAVSLKAGFEGESGLAPLVMQSLHLGVLTVIAGLLIRSNGCVTADDSANLV